MTTLFSREADTRDSEYKQQILRICTNGDISTAELSKELNISIPTAAKFIGELISDGFLTDMGKQLTSSGRKPSIYGLNPSVGYIVGAEVTKDSVNLTITDFKGQEIVTEDQVPFCLESTTESFRKLAGLLAKICKDNDIDMSSALACGLTLSGRVNAATGYSFTYYISEDKPLTEFMSNLLGVPVIIENDSRAMTYGEYVAGEARNVKNAVFINVGWGLGSGMILDGKLYYGKSGFSGEIGHFPMLDNDIICQCGKVGCLETQASGSALHRIFTERLASGRSSCLSDKYAKNEEITMDDIISATNREDVLAIEVIEEIGTTLGKGLAGLINIVNPEMVIIGGRLASVGDYLTLPVKSALNKYSLNMVSRDTTIKTSRLGTKAGPVGICFLARNRILGVNA